METAFDEVCWLSPVRMLPAQDPSIMHCTKVYGAGYQGQRWRDTSLRGKLDDLWLRLHGDKGHRNNVLQKVRKFNAHNNAIIGGKENQDEVEQDNNSNDDDNGNDDGLNYNQFQKALQDMNVTISPELAQNIFKQIDSNDNGIITKIEMDGLLATLDEMDFTDLSDLANNQELLNLCLTKKVMDCLLTDEGLQFVETDFVFDLKTNLEFNDPEALSYLSRLGMITFSPITF